MFLCFPDCDRLLLWTICCPKNSCTALMTLPTEIWHRLHDHHWRNQCFPQLAEGGVGSGVDYSVILFSSQTRQIPLLDTLDGNSFMSVPWDPSRHKQAILLCVVEEKSHDILDGWKREGITRLPFRVAVDAWCARGHPPSNSSLSFWSASRL